MWWDKCILGWVNIAGLQDLMCHENSKPQPRGLLSRSCGGSHNSWWGEKPASTNWSWCISKTCGLAHGWWQHNDVASLAEVNSSVSVPNLDGKWYQKYWAFAGLGFLIIVAYMDPRNWATDLSGVPSFGYTLLSIILIWNFTAIFLQYLSLKLGIVTNQDLAQACQDVYPKWVVYCLWISMEIAIASTDLAKSSVQLLHWTS